MNNHLDHFVRREHRLFFPVALRVNTSWWPVGQLRCLCVPNSDVGSTPSPSGWRSAVVIYLPRMKSEIATIMSKDCSAFRCSTLSPGTTQLELEILSAQYSTKSRRVPTVIVQITPEIRIPGLPRGSSEAERQLSHLTGH